MPEPNEVPVLVAALSPHKSALHDTLWHNAEAPEAEKQAQRFRAACALAKYDPDNHRWAKIRPQIADDLLAVPTMFWSTWADSLSDVGGHLQDPLAKIFRDGKRKENERILAAKLLAVYAVRQPAFLADLVMDADEKQFAIVFPIFKDRGIRGLAALNGEVDRRLPPSASNIDKESLAKRQANAAVALVHLGDAANVWPLLKHSADPRGRSCLIHRFGPLGVNVANLVHQLDVESDVAIQRALILSLGEYTQGDLPPAVRVAMTKKLKGIYRSAADPGVVAAAEWLLRHWNNDRWLNEVDKNWAENPQTRDHQLAVVKTELDTKKGSAQAQWIVNSQGGAMIVVPGPTEFMMGSPCGEHGRFSSEKLHKRTINRTFAIAAKAATIGEYRLFEPSYRSRFQENLIPTDDCPVSGISWYQAAAYCNWLSEQEGMAPNQHCYATNKQGRVTTLKANYLSLTGYRLPTEAEIEYAIRAGAVTSRCYGETDELLDKYAWYEKERVWPVGIKKPNDLGLFDMHGNVWCWCQDRERPYPADAGGDTEDALEIISTVPRMLRGGSHGCKALEVRAANRLNDIVPTATKLNFGFRLARTFPP